jgi:cellulose synthase/poly-beta-1,6-N-acetylglucosamine synthase-like glycosyltransferase
VGICAHNEELNIGKLLNNILFEQELPPKSEVLVVCSGCTDETVKIVQTFQKKDSRIKPVVEKERNGKASAVNQIFSKAKGDIILFISADTLPNKNCFLKLISKFEDQKIGIVCGKPVPTNNTTSLTGKIVKLLWSFHDRVFTELNKTGQLHHASEIFCIRKGIVDKIPQETVNDDAYIALTAKKKGWKISYEPQGIVSMCGPQTIPDYFKQRRRILWGHYQVKKLTGKSPQYLVHMIPLDPTNGLKLTLKLFSENGILTVSAFLLIEFVINYLAIIDSIFGKSYTKWSSVKTTKKLKNS